MFYKKKIESILNQQRVYFSEKEKENALAYSESEKISNYLENSNAQKVSDELKKCIHKYVMHLIFTRHNNFSRPSDKRLLKNDNSFLQCFFNMGNNFIPFYNKYYIKWWLKFNWDFYVEKILEKYTYIKELV